MKPLAPVCLLIVAGTLVAGSDDFKSGPQVGAKISRPFEIRMCNGPDAGDFACLV